MGCALYGLFILDDDMMKNFIQVSRVHETTGFFTFDGSKYLKEGSMKYWIFGHTHDQTEFEMEGVKCICNPMGYPSENNYGELTQIRSIKL